MPERELESFWWEEVAGPRSLVAGITEALLECKSVALVVPADLPWRHHMRRSVRGILESTPGIDSLYIESIDVGDEEKDEAPESLVLKRLALYEQRIHYRAGMETVQNYASRLGLLTNRIVWVKGANPKQSTAWIDFCRQWHPRNPKEGLFVIEDHSGVGDPTGSLVTIDYSKCADDNSVRLFTWSMLADEKHARLTPRWRAYMVSALANLCREDVEIATALANDMDITKDDPISGILALSQSSQFSRRGEQGTDHVLALARDEKLQDLRLRLWSAQIEVLFPIIEASRIGIVEWLSDDLSRLIDEGVILQFGKPVTEVRDVELGTLVHLMSRDDEGRRFLYVNDDEKRESIFFLWKCRNLLAHREVCTPEQVSKLFAIA